MATLPERMSKAETDVSWLKRRLDKLERNDVYILIGQGITSGFLGVVLLLLR